MRYHLLIRCLTALIILATAAVGFALPETVHWSAKATESTVAPNGWLTVTLTAKIDKGWHLYSQTVVPDGPQPTQFKLPAGSVFTKLDAVKQETPEKKLDPNFGKEVEFYAGTATFTAPVQVSKTASGAQTGKITVRFMSCNDHTCMPPRNVDVPVTFTVAGAPAADTPAAPASGTAESNVGVHKAEKGGLLAFLLLSISAGFVALLTPCVFPMIPITVSFFAKRRETEGAGSALGQAAAYCGGIVLTFTAIGVLVAAIFGASGLQLLATNPWLNLALAALFTALALNLFGVFEVTLPGGLANRFSPQGKNKYVAPVLMALAFTITSFTCTLPFVGTLLVTAAQGDYFYPVVGMLGFSTAFALPFFLLALFPQALAKLPRGGAWMVVVKAFMGFLELAAAVKFYSNADLVWQLGWLTRPVFLAIWTAIMVGAGLYMVGGLRIPTVEDGKIGIPRRIIGLACLASAVTLLAGLNGKHLGELDSFLPPSDYGFPKSEGADTRWIDSYEKGLAEAKASGKPMFIDFTGVTCTNCRQMEKNVFPNPAVADRLNKFVLVRLYTDRDQESDRANQKLQEKMTGSVTLPIYVALTSEGAKQAVFEGSTRDIGAFTGFLDEGLK